MDEGKVDAVHTWPIPTTVKELQWFLGFANFYWRFTKHFISTHKSPERQVQVSVLDPRGQMSHAETWGCLHQSTALLIHPDPEKPFVVEVDASTTRVGAVLSQQQGKPSRLNPCAFLSKKLTTKCNYDIGNQELHAIKLAKSSFHSANWPSEPRIPL